MCPTNNDRNAARGNAASLDTTQQARRRLVRERDLMSATDDPPPLLNRTAEIVPVQSQTPQHVATLVAPTYSTSLAEPIIVNNKYFVWGLADGKIGLWNNEQITGATAAAPRTPVNPASVLETRASTPWMQLLQFSFENTNQTPEILGLTSSGVFFHVKLEPKLEVVKTWHTKRPGATCFCITKSHSVYVGYDNGNLEAWKKEKRLWFGNFKQYPGIRSIIPLETSTQKYVLLTLEPKDSTRTPSTIEIVCLTLLESNADRDRTKAVSLDEYWVPLPEAGREVADASALSAAHQQRFSQRFETHWIPSHGSHVATLLPDASHVMVEVADGSVLFLDATMNESNELCWGVLPGHNRGQFLLSFPSIGRGIIDMNGKPFAACALRGGTVYLFPLPTPDSTSGDDEEIRSCLYPDDISTDSSMQHLQAFAAGNFDMPNISEEKSSFPLLLFCWPGGICDVYCVHLLPSLYGNTNEDMVALAENGAVDDLRRFLQSLSNDPDNLLADLLWAKARQEILDWKTRESTIDHDDLESVELLHFQRLLQKLADPLTDDPIDAQAST